MSPKLKTTGVFLALALGSVLAVHQAGCLSPQQKVDMAAYSQALEKDQGVVLSVQSELAKYAEQLKAVVADVKAGRIPAASGLELGQKIMANMDSARARLSEALAAVAETKTAVKKLQESGTPWWAYAIPTGLTLAQLLGTFVPQLSFLVPIAGALKGQLAGAQTQLVQTQGKLATTQEVAGSLSRTLDSLVEKEPQVATPLDGQPRAVIVQGMAERKEQLLLREQQADELAVKADYDELRQLARCKQI